MWRTQVKLNVISYNAAISACEKGKQWEQALSLLKKIWRSQLEPDVIQCSSEPDGA